MIKEGLLFSLTVKRLSRRVRVVRCTSGARRTLLVVSLRAAASAAVSDTVTVMAMQPASCRSCTVRTVVRVY
jgi:hypothetical protein